MLTRRFDQPTSADALANIGHCLHLPAPAPAGCMQGDVQCFGNGSQVFGAGSRCLLMIRSALVA